MSSTGAGVAVYTGVFDPVHLGHLDVIRRGSDIFERLVVGVGINPEKSPLFAPEERVELLRRVVMPFANVQVLPFDGLAVRFVREVGARIMLRAIEASRPKARYGVTSLARFAKWAKWLLTDRMADAMIRRRYGITRGAQ